MRQTGDSVLYQNVRFCRASQAYHILFLVVHSPKPSTIFSFYQAKAFGQEHHNVLSPHTLIKLQFVHPIYQPYLTQNTQLNCRMQ